MVNAGCEGFRGGAEKYAAYLETVEGRLRLDLAFANLQEFLPGAGLRILDIGCGPGAAAVHLAEIGHHVTLLDSSSAMLDLARRAAEQAGVTEKVSLILGDAAQMLDVAKKGSFDVIVCHNLLEYVDDPGAVLRFASDAMYGRSALISLLVRNRAGEVLKAALNAGDLNAAEESLTAEWGHESLYGGSVRLFTQEAVRTMVRAASLEIRAERGVRVLSDYLPPQISRTADYQRIFELERNLGRRPEFTAVARYIQYLVYRADKGVS